MDTVRREEMRTSAAAVREAVGATDKGGVRRLFGAVHKSAKT